MLESADRILVSRGSLDFNLLDTSIFTFWNGKDKFINYKTLLKNHLFKDFEWISIPYKTIKKNLPDYLIINKQENLEYKLVEEKVVTQHYTEFIIKYMNIHYDVPLVICTGRNRATATYNLFYKLSYKNLLKYGANTL